MKPKDGVDFIRLHKKMEANNATLIDLILTIDIAKHLAMMERNEIGLGKISES